MAASLFMLYRVVMSGAKLCLSVTRFQAECRVQIAVMMIIIEGSNLTFNLTFHINRTMKETQLDHFKKKWYTVRNIPFN